MPNGNHKGLVGASTADNSLTVCVTQLYPLSKKGIKMFIPI
jgi:hypothetical protein